MARPQGARNQDYDEVRMGLAREVRGYLLGTEAGVRASLRDMAEAAGSSVSTLKHYFGDREGVLVAVLDSMAVDGAPYLAQISLVSTGDVRASLIAALQQLATGWVKYEVGKLHGFAMAVGLAERRLGPSYLNRVLEPPLQAFEALLRRHVELGHLEISDLRHAALTLLGPVLLALLHQHELSGASQRPLDVDALLIAHVDTFLRAWPSAAKPSRKRH